MIRGLAAFMLVLGWAVAAVAGPVTLTTGDHPGFTRLVLQFGSTVNWQMGRTVDGYELRLPDARVQYDLSRAFDQIGKNRLAAIWADPTTGALHVGVACACFAMPFEFRPGIVVIDLRDGTPPKRSSFELPLDGGTAAALSARSPVRPKPRPGLGPGGPQPVYDWQAFATMPLQPPPAMTPLPLPESVRNTETGPAVDQNLESLRLSLIQQMGKGAAQGIVDMAKPAKPVDPADHTEPSVRLRLGPTPDIVVRQKGEAHRPLTAEGADCIADDRLDIFNWANDRPVAVQMGPAFANLTGEFDRVDPEAVKRAVRFDLNLSFGAEARAMLRAFRGDQPDAAIWESMARIMDGQADAAPAFTGMTSCATAAALWAALADPLPREVDMIGKAAILRGFSALPGHLRRHLGPALVNRFLKSKDLVTATALRDAILRSPGDPGPEVELLQAAMDAYGGDTSAADARLNLLAGQSGPVTAEALVTLVEQRAALAQDVTLDQVQALAAFLKERRGGPEEPRFQRALILAEAASGDFDKAFADAPGYPDTIPVLWQILAKAGPESALLSVATLPGDSAPPAGAKGSAAEIARRMMGLGMADQANVWLQFSGAADPLLAATIALAQRNPQRAIQVLDGFGTPAAATLRAMAQEAAGQDKEAGLTYAAIGKQDEVWRAAGRAHDWEKLASGGPDPWKTAAATVMPAQTAVAPAAGQTPPLAGPLAQGRDLLAQSAATRDALTALLDAVKIPPPPSQ